MSEHEYFSPIFDSNIENDEFVQAQENNAFFEVGDIDKGNDEILIDAVRQYPHLYDASLKEYKYIKMKENSWSEIGSIMNMSSKIYIRVIFFHFVFMTIYEQSTIDIYKFQTNSFHYSCKLSDSLDAFA